jgi:superfamily II DNA or RNA helicase
MELRPYQNEAVASVEAEFSHGVRSTLIVLATGCHAIGEKILLANGDTASVENVHAGDLLLGMDGTPRRVLAVHHGNKPCYEISPIKGKPFVVTEDHMLSLVQTTIRQNGFPSQTGGNIVDITVKEYIGKSRTFKHRHKLFRAPMLDFHLEKDEPPIPPYILGVMLGDGGLKYDINVTTADPEVLEELSSYARSLGYTLRSEPAGLANTWIFQTGEMGCNGSRLRGMLARIGLLGCGSGEKHIPRQYLTASIQDRLDLLAGLIDTDGSKSSNGSCDYITKSPRLADGICFICRSLGLAAYSHPCEKSIKSIGFVGTYYRVSISGDLSIIPTRVSRRKFDVRRQKKSVLRTGLSIRPVGVKEYFGFTVDGDNRYLLDDFTVTHNCGKTIVFSHLAAREVRRGGRVLILAHRGELLQQAIAKLRSATGIEAGLEKAEETSAVAWDEIPYTVVVGSVQSMKSQKRLARFLPDEFSLIVIDECHHALTGTYRAVIDHFPKARLLGVTATPDRGDLRSLSEVFETIAYEYSIVDAIKGGWLSPVFVQTVPLRIDLSGVAVQSGDFQAASLGSALDPYLRQICREIKERCYARKTIVFTPLIATSRKMLQIFVEEGVQEVREVNGESPDRADILDWFSQAPAGCVLLNSMLLTEGYDEPSVDCIVVLRATKVRALFVQMVGRGTRLSPSTGKQNLLLLDFLWLTSTHDLCRPACLLSDDSEVCETITKKQESKGCAELDLSPEALEDAQSETVKKREDALAKRLAAQSRKKGKLFDALQFAELTGVTNLSDVPTTIQENDRPTMEMVDRLERLGFACPGSQTAAEKLLTAYQQRVDSGLSSHKQIKRLTIYGFHNVANWPFSAAKKMMDRIAASGWRVPRGIDPETYAP